MTECADWLTNLSKYIADLNTELVKTKTENAKLRKIVREQAANIEGYSCNECPYNEECNLDTVPMHDGCRMYAEMRELGIEENG